MHCLRRLHRHRMCTALSWTADILHHAVAVTKEAAHSVAPEVELLDVPYSAVIERSPEVWSCIPHHLLHPSPGFERPVTGQAVQPWGVFVVNHCQETAYWSSAIPKFRIRSYSSQAPAPDLDSKELREPCQPDSAAAAAPHAHIGNDAPRKSAGRQSAVPDQSPAENSAMAGSESFAQAGWTRQEVWNVPNAISMARLVSGPVIATWIIAGEWHVALLAVAISGWSDWLDGYLARLLDQQTVLGSYLDPIADKGLIACVVGALGYQGLLPAPLVALILGRDALLVAGCFAARSQALGWQWPGMAEFFRIGPPDDSQVAKCKGFGKVSPIYISKVNTVVQLITVACYLSHSAFQWPSPDALTLCAYITAVTTAASGVGYVQVFLRGHG